MLKKNIRKEDLKKIKEEILQVLEKVFDWPGLFEKVWPEGRFAVTDALLEFLKIPKDRMAKAECSAFGNKPKISRFRLDKIVERIFDNFKEAPMPLDEIHWTDYKTFVKSLSIADVFVRYVEFIDFDPDDMANEKDAGHESGMAY